MKKLDAVSKRSLIAYHTVLMGMVGLLCGITYAFGGLAIDTLVSLNWIPSTETPGLSHGTILAFGALVGMPLIGVGVGIVLGILSAVLYPYITKYGGAIVCTCKK